MRGLCCARCWWGFPHRFINVRYYGLLSPAIVNCYEGKSTALNYQQQPKASRSKKLLGRWYG